MLDDMSSTNIADGTDTGQNFKQGQKVKNVAKYNEMGLDENSLRGVIIH